MRQPVQHQPSICLIDTQADTRKVFSESLERAGFQVCACASATEMVARGSTRPFDIVVVDTSLADEDAFAVIAFLSERSEAAESGAPRIVALTAPGQVGERLRALRSGADVCLARPVDAHELAAVLHSLERRRRADSAPRQAAVANSGANSGANTGANTGTTGDADAARGWQLDMDGYALWTPRGMRLALTEAERVLVAKLMEQRGAVVSRATLTRAYNLDPATDDPHRLDMVVSRLRHKAAAQNIVLPLHAIRGKGYVFSQGAGGIRAVPDH